jgi:hypothetical protein
MSDAHAQRGGSGGRSAPGLTDDVLAEQIEYYRARAPEYDTSEDGIVVRRLNDGREFRAVKIYYDPDELSRVMSSIGWRVEIETTTPWSFYYGSGGRG